MRAAQRRTGQTLNIEPLGSEAGGWRSRSVRLFGGGAGETSLKPGTGQHRWGYVIYHIDLYCNVFRISFGLDISSVGHKI